MLCCAVLQEAPIHAKLLLHYARRLAAKAGAPAPGDTHWLVAAEAVLVVSQPVTNPLQTPIGQDTSILLSVSPTSLCFLCSVLADWLAC